MACHYFSHPICVSCLTVDVRFRNGSLNKICSLRTFVLVMSIDKCDKCMYVAIHLFLGCCLLNPKIRFKWLWLGNYVSHCPNMWSINHQFNEPHLTQQKKKIVHTNSRRAITQPPTVCLVSVLGSLKHS